MTALAGESPVPTIAELRKLLRELQKRWRMTDWTIEANIVDRLGPGTTSPWALVHYDEYHRFAKISLARNPEPTDQGICPEASVCLAHEFAHLLLVDLKECLEDAIRTSSVDAQQQTRLRWELGEERFCNVFAEAVTGR